MDSTRLAIADWIEPEDFLLDVEVRDRQHAMEVMAGTIGRSHGLDPAPIVRALERRERAGSTALGNGFAIPHARIPGLGRPLTLFMRTSAGIGFGAPDGKPVSDLLAILVPVDGDKEEHLRLLALISRLFSDGEFRALLDRAPDAATAALIFRAAALRVCGPTQ